MSALENFTQWLRHPMADEDWARDLAERIIAYDPLATVPVNIQFEPGDRIVVSYRATGKSRALRTFVVPCWVKPS